MKKLILETLLFLLENMDHSKCEKTFYDCHCGLENKILKLKKVIKKETKNDSTQKK